MKVQVRPIQRQGLNSLAEPCYPDSYIRIVDFSGPVDSSKDTIDISTDMITIPIRLPDDVPRVEDGVLWISDGVMHMLPGVLLVESTFDEYWDSPTTVTAVPDTTPLPPPTSSSLSNKIWNFDLKTQTWDVQVSGVEDTVHPAIAFDTKTQVGWYYGGQRDGIGLQGLYRLDRWIATPIKVETDSSLVGAVAEGLLIYIGGAGKAGILVLLGGYAGATNDEFVSMMDQIGRPFCPPFWLILIHRGQ